MTSVTRIRPALIAIFLTMLFGLAPGFAFAEGAVTEVKLSDDGKRLVIAFRGHVGEARSFTNRDASKLIVALEEAQPLESLVTPHSMDPSIKSVRIRKKKTATRVEIDFGKAAIRDHKMRRLPGCVVVFFGDVIYPRSTVASRKRPTRRSASGADEQWEAAPAGAGATRLKLMSADVVGGRIVLQVADERNPGRAYRIYLGVDLAQPGFTSADIRRVRSR